MIEKILPEILEKVMEKYMKQIDVKVEKVKEDIVYLKHQTDEIIGSQCYISSEFHVMKTKIEAMDQK